MTIAYCEDEAAQAAWVEKLICGWAAENEKNCNVRLFPSAESFLFELNGAELVPYDLVMLDISMEGMDGFSLARQLRQKDKNVRIAFLTSDSSHVFEGYEIDAWRYLLKPLEKPQVFKMLQALCVELEQKESEYFLLDVSGENIKIALEELDYVEVNGHYTTLHGSRRDYTVKENFGELLMQLNGAAGNERFVKCHRSAAVNISRLVRIGRQNCILESGIELPVSRGMYQQLNEVFIRRNL